MGQIRPENRHFDTSHLEGNLRGRFLRGGIATGLAQGTKFLLGLGSTMILARLLTPADFGLVAMVAPIIGFVALFKDMGLTMATVQRAEINHEQISTLFWFNVAVSAVLGLATLTLAPVVGWFYDDPRATWITMAFAAMVLLGGLSAQHQALLQRQMRFRALASAEITALTGGILVAVVLAWLQFDYWALVFLQITNGTLFLTLLWMLCDWRPGKPERRTGVRPMISYGGGLTSYNVINYFSRNLDNVLIGKVWGDAALGLYSRAYSLLLLPIQQINAPISAVAVPTLSRLQKRPDQFRMYYRKMLGGMVFAGAPVTVACFLTAEEIVRVALGTQWLGAVPIFLALAPAAFLGTFNAATGWVYISLGKTTRMAKWGLFASAVTVMAFATGLPWGALGVALAFSISRIILKPLDIIYCFRGSRLALADAWQPIWPPAGSALAAGLAVYIVKNHLIVITHPLASLGIFWLLLAVFYLAIMALCFDAHRTYVPLIRELSGEKRGTPPPVVDVPSLPRDGNPP